MNYYSTKLGIGPMRLKTWQNIIANVLMAIFPKANPDFEKKYTDVRLWWLELNDSKIPEREIGFDTNGEVIVAAPIGNNYGFWTESTKPVVVDENLTSIDSSEFQAAWNNFEVRWKESKKSLRWLTRRSS